MKSDKFSLVLIEDNQIVLKALTLYFNRSSKFKLVFSANSTEAFIDTWKDQHIDIVLCDIGLPGKSGIEATQYV